ncbi:hypothetical protein U9M48_040385 [Paspalum notatum var. saurae]|uniref:Uncharacterized protein n=1 Tax=Paspalum notatum var. saurae TaxID=547442 RepID=A0AAQ3ULL5_PASNO
MHQHGGRQKHMQRRDERSKKGVGAGGAPDRGVVIRYEGPSKVPRNVVRHMNIVDQLKGLFMNEESAKLMRYHARSSEDHHVDSIAADHGHNEANEACSTEPTGTTTFNTKRKIAH